MLFMPQRAAWLYGGAPCYATSIVDDLVGDPTADLAELSRYHVAVGANVGHGNAKLVATIVYGKVAVAGGSHCCHSS